MITLFVAGTVSLLAIIMIVLTVLVGGTVGALVVGDIAVAIAIVCLIWKFFHK